MPIFNDDFWARLTWPFRSAGGAAGAAAPLGRYLLQPVITAVLTVVLLYATTYHGCIPGPGPLPPVPPGPVPPVPPVPPGPVQGLRVLIIEETSERSKLPAGQLAVILGTPMRTFLDSKTPFGKDGKTHTWDIWDRNVDAANADPEAKALFARPHPTLPWIVLADSAGKVVFEGALPADVEATKALITKYTGG